MDLDAVRTCALLHDVGKPLCWALGESFERHVVYTEAIVKEHLGPELARVSSRHHYGPGYPDEYRPKTMEEWIVGIADTTSSGADRPERGVRVRVPPVRLTFPLSGGEIVCRELSGEELKEVNKEVEGILREVSGIAQRGLREAYLELYEKLERSSLKDVPADTRRPINDHSLWDHLKMTAAFATCIYLECEREGRLIGRSPGDYEFTLIGGDADRIGEYINRSLRLPDLRAGSKLVEESVRRAREVVCEALGPECVVFSGGGNILCISPPHMADELIEKMEEAFSEPTSGELGITFAKVEASGEDFKERFGDLWERVGEEVRRRKARKTPKMPEPVPEGVPLCDVCGLRPKVREDTRPYRVLPYDASPRPEGLCEVCWSRRFSPFSEGCPIDDLADEQDYIAVIKLDGDEMGKVFSGEVLKKFGKQVTPSRMAFISRYVDETCKNLEKVVEKYGGEAIYAAGDDVLAIVGGRHGFKCALELYETFTEAMHEKVTASAGLVLSKKKFPIYVSLRVLDRLLRNAKEMGRDSVDFSVIYQVGVTEEDVSAERRREMRSRKLSNRPYKWREFREFLSFLETLRTGHGIAPSQLRRVAAVLTSSTGPERFKQALVLIKSGVGRGIISYEDAKKLIDGVEKGSILDAISVLKRVGG